MPRTPPKIAEMRGSNLTIYWSVYFTIILFLIATATWLAFNWRLYVLGVHVHHFPLGIVSIALAFISFGIGSAQITLTFVNPFPFGQARVSLSLKYTVTPFLSGAVWMVTGVFLLLTDWPDFAAWMSNPALFNWGA